MRPATRLANEAAQEPINRDWCRDVKNDDRGWLIAKESPHLVGLVSVARDTVENQRAVVPASIECRAH
jgi:hypothetical protein